MTASEALHIATALIVSLGGGGAVVLTLSSFLGKVWANRILESEKAKLSQALADHQAKIDKAVHRANVAAARIDAQQSEAIRELYAALIGWHEAAITISAPNDFLAKPKSLAPYFLSKYATWAKDLHERAQTLERCAMHTAIYFNDETCQLIARCGFAASSMSIDFYTATQQDTEPGTSAHLERVEQARAILQSRYDTDYQKARVAVISAFREIIIPKDTV